jgi:glycolate oxidase FAD binding subunit
MSTATTTQEGHDRTGRTVRPASLSETVEELRASSGSVLIRGAGTKQTWGGVVREPDLVVDTTAMDEVITHNPADMTVSVQAGIPLRVLQEHVASDGQWVALDPASAAAGATVGGLLAAGDSGPSRQKYGGLRDLVIGTTVVLADGSVGRSGGHVIKNVAGYDLTKLMHGSLGSLALVGEVVLRLHPMPQRRRTVRVTADAATATKAVLELAAGPLEPSRIAWSGSPGQPGVLAVGVEGSDSAADSAAQRVASALTEYEISPEVLDDGDAEQVWAEHDAQVVGADGDTVLSVNGLPSGLPALAEEVRRGAEESGVTAQMASWAGQGMNMVRFTGGEAEQHARAVRAVRAYAERAGCATLLRRRPELLDDHVDALGTPPSWVGMLRAIKNQFDPDHRLAPGRFGGWYEQAPTSSTSGRRGSA